jgi:hypothetical protein
MTFPSLPAEPGRIDEPRAAPEFSDALTRVAAEHRPVIVRRDGEDLAALIPLEYLDLVREALARQEVEQVAGQIDWERARPVPRPPQAWFDDEEDYPFEPEKEPAP